MLLSKLLHLITYPSKLSTFVLQWGGFSKPSFPSGNHQLIKMLPIGASAQTVSKMLTCKNYFLIVVYMCVYVPRNLEMLKHAEIISDYLFLMLSSPSSCV